MRTLGNILWHVPFLGFLSAIFTYLLGLLFTVTVVGAPLGLGLMELGKFYLAPFTRAMVADSELDPNAEVGLWKAYSWIVMIIWFPFGLILAVSMVFQAFFLCCTIVGIPLAIVVAKAIGTVFNPVGKRCVSVGVAEELLRRAAMPQAAAAARSYLEQAGGVTCDLAPGGGWRCVSLSKGLDIAEVFALSGFAKAAVNAPDFIRNAEGMARESRRGVWGAS